MSPCIPLGDRGHVCFASPDGYAELKRLDCPTCERSVFAVCVHYEWYGWSVSCLGCGENWEDGERLERPFERAWRKKSKDAARQLYRRLRRPTTEGQE